MDSEQVVPSMPPTFKGVHPAGSDLAPGDRVKIISLNRSYLGSYLNQHIKKFIGTTASVAEVIPTLAKSNIVIIPDGVKTTLRVNRAELQKI